MSEAGFAHGSTEALVLSIPSQVIASANKVESKLKPKNKKRDAYPSIPADNYYLLCISWPTSYTPFHKISVPQKLLKDEQVNYMY